MKTSGPGATNFRGGKDVLYQISWSARARTGGTWNGDLRLEREKALDPAALDGVRLHVEDSNRFIEKGSVVIVSIWKYED